MRRLRSATSGAFALARLRFACARPVVWKSLLQPYVRIGSGAVSAYVRIRSAFASITDIPTDHRDFAFVPGAEILARAERPTKRRDLGAQFFCFAMDDERRRQLKRGFSNLRCTC